MRLSRLLPVALGALLVVLLALLGGVWLGAKSPQSVPAFARSALGITDERAVRAEVLELIEENYYKPVEREKLEQASLRGIVRSLDDRFSHYFTPDQAKRFEQAVQGQFEGVGMTVEKVKRGLLVQQVFEGAPAEKAGIRKGDTILAADGDPLAGEPTESATAKIKGPPGTKVRLRVLSPDRAPREITVERARIDVPVVQSEIRRRDGDKLGVVRLTAFTPNAHGKLREEIDALLEKDAEGLVLDLRGNGGGLLQEAVLVSSIFLDKGKLVVSTRGRERPRRTYDAQGGPIPADVPLVVLVDRFTASAAEIVSGALKDHERATVIGQKTFGKGVVQEVDPLPNGGALSLTVASYFLPDGANINKKGIVPDRRAIDRPRTRRDEALPAALEALAARVE